MIVVDPSLFLPPGEFERRAAEFAAGIRATPPAPGFCAVRMPSDRSIQVRAQRRRDGIEIDRAVYERLDSIRRSGPGADAAAVHSAASRFVVKVTPEDRSPGVKRPHGNRAQGVFDG